MGSPTGRRQRTPDELRARIRELSVVDESGCWLWQGEKNERGYAYMCAFGKLMRVHRLSYLLFNGNLDGPQVRHTCDVKDCVNPDHLVLGTAQDNSNDMKERNRPRGRYRTTT